MEKFVIRPVNAKSTISKISESIFSALIITNFCNK